MTRNDWDEASRMFSERNEARRERDAARAELADERRKCVKLLEAWSVIAGDRCLAVKLQDEPH